MSGEKHSVFFVSLGALVAFGLTGDLLGAFVLCEVLGVTALAL